MLKYLGVNFDGYLASEALRIARAGVWAANAHVVAARRLASSET